MADDAASSSSDGGDTWCGSEASDRAVGERDLALLEERLRTDGFREGAAVGKEKGLQGGFEEGLVEALPAAYETGFVLGAIEALTLVHGGDDEFERAAADARRCLLAKQKPPKTALDLIERCAPSLLQTKQKRPNNQSSRGGASEEDKIE